jgi:hypothetical protein
MVHFHLVIGFLLGFGLGLGLRLGCSFLLTTTLFVFILIATLGRSLFLFLRSFLGCIARWFALALALTFLFDFFGDCKVATCVGCRCST